MKRIFALALVLVSTLAAAQTTPAKKELVARILQLQQASIEGVARAMAEQPAALVMQRANAVLQSRIPPDKREAIAKDVQVDLKKYVDEAVPVVRERAVKLAPGTIGAILEEKFSEDELKQLIAIIESPVNRKYVQLGGEMQKAFSDKLVAETRSLIDPKIKAMELAVATHLGIPVTAPPAPPSTTARPPARPASN